MSLKIDDQYVKENGRNRESLRRIKSPEMGSSWKKPYVVLDQ